MTPFTTLKADKELSIDLLIVAKITGQSKKKLTDNIIREGLKPYMEQIKKQRFS